MLGRRMEDQLRFAACYWHSFVGTGTDPFGDATFARPWHAGGDRCSRRCTRPTSRSSCSRCWTCRSSPSTTATSRPRARTLAESNDNVRRIADVFERKMAQTPACKLLWGTANLFSHPRYMAGAATNPDPDVFAYAAAQVRNVLEVTHRLGGANYVLWGGREGYETLLNTDLKRELAQMGRFLSMVVEHKHKIGFKGQILDRAQAGGADQAPVRLRRRHGLRLPAHLRPGRRGQGQHRAEPRAAGGPHLRARDRAGAGARASSARWT